ncbi:DNA-binding response regulator [Georhizobium profundi]|jgi:FixJ family two-component response regulator|uniref:DNA-binding response regulator n=2 Tax=Rhizobiaceae TaxID=82115 RepID=A0A3S9B7E7_9HYPH|nr:DNA-binding response regulator [Georhizobium profundi]
MWDDQRQHHRERSRFMSLHVVVRDTGLGDSLMLVLKQQGFAARLHVETASLCRQEALSPEDTVILDLDLPNGQAAGLVDRMEREQTPCRLIVLAGVTSRAARARLGTAGPMAVLTKPFAASDLLALLGTPLH